MAERRSYGPCAVDGCTAEAFGPAARCKPHFYGAKNLFFGARQRAAKKNLEFTLSEEWLLEKIAAANELCPACGGLMRFMAPDKNNSLSLDRIDSAKGYTPDNVQLLCKRCNTLKSNGDLEDRLKLIKNDVLNDSDPFKALYVLRWAHQLMEEVVLWPQYEDALAEEYAS
jgi:hypothetical protein